MVGSALHRDSKERYKPIVWLGLGLVLALRFVLRLGWALITATKIVVGVVFDGTRK